MQPSGVAEVERAGSKASAIADWKGSLASMLSGRSEPEDRETDRQTILSSPFDNVSAAIGRVRDERRTLFLAEAIVDPRPSADMSQWSAELDDEARAIHHDLMDATHRALGDD